MLRDKSTLTQRRGKGNAAADGVVSGSAPDDKSAIDKKAAKPRHKKKTEEELDEEFEAACEKWCGMGIRLVFMMYSMFGFFTSTYEWATRPDMTNVLPATTNLAGTNVVITGGCSGVGLETARMMAGAGARVIVGCRPPRPRSSSSSSDDDGDDDDASDFGGFVDVSSAVTDLFHDADDEDTAATMRKMDESGGSASRYALDLTDFASVRAFAGRVVDDLDNTIDVVIHNAGTIAGCTNTTDGFDVSLQTNYLAPVLINRLLLPTLKANPHGAARVVHVTCTAASKNSKADAAAVAPAAKRCHPAVAYADSKLLLERHSAMFASKFGGNNNHNAIHANEKNMKRKKNNGAGMVIANAVDPGAVKSNFLFKGGPGTTPAGSSRRFHPAAIVGWILGKFTTGVFGPHGASKFFMRSVEHGAAAVVHVAVSDAAGREGGRLYADVAGAFTHATGCGPSTPAQDCGWVRPPWEQQRGHRRQVNNGGKKPAGAGELDADALARREKRETREREDKEIWSATSKLLEPWSDALPTKE